MITSSIYVPDASVILKWVFDTPGEEDRGAALTLLNAWVAGECEFVLPPLWIYEVGNIIGRTVPETEKAMAFMELLIDYKITETPVSIGLANRTLEIMADCKVTFYDAVYHALAIERQGTLVTADGSYLKKAGKLGHAILLADLGR